MRGPDRPNRGDWIILAVCFALLILTVWGLATSYPMSGR